MDVVCNLCGSRKADYFFANFDRMMRINDQYNLYQCKECGLIYIYPQPPNSSISKNYNKESYTVFSEEEFTQNLRKLYISLSSIYYLLSFKKYPWPIKIFLIIFYPIKSFFRTFNFIEDGNFLDVGCGNGFFLFIMKYLGMDSFGIEPGPFNDKLASDYNLKIFRGTLLDAKYDSNFFDIITLNHVLEHVDNPDEYFKELWRILKPGGYLIIAVPLGDSLASVLFKRYWSQLDTPRHLFIFSKNNLKKYAYKHNFKVIKININSTPPFQFILSIVYILEELLNKSFNRNIIYNPFLNLILIPITMFLNFLGYGDQCEIILSKKV